MVANVSWTKQEDDILRELIAMRIPVPKIANVLKSRTIHAIRGRCQDLEISLYGNGPEIDLDAYKKIMKGVK